MTEPLKPGAKRYKLQPWDERECPCHADLDVYGWYSTVGGEAIDGGFCSYACAMESAKRHAKRCNDRIKWDREHGYAV
jgi:hypothetical protein